MRTSVLGIGIDIEEIPRFKKLKLTTSNKFLNKIFTSRELDYCFSKKNIASSLATKFSAKEAVIKAYNSFSKTILDYKQIEILNDNSGMPFVKLTKIKSENYQIMISLSNSLKQAVAVAVIT